MDECFDIEIIADFLGLVFVISSRGTLPIGQFSWLLKSQAHQTFLAFLFYSLFITLRVRYPYLTLTCKHLNSHVTLRPLYTQISLTTSKYKQNRCQGTTTFASVAVAFESVQTSENGKSHRQKDSKVYCRAFRS